MVETAPVSSSLKKGVKIVAIDPAYFRPAEVESLLGDAEKARRKLGWEPQTSFESLVEEMVQADLQIAQRDHLVKSGGFAAFDYHE